MKRLLLASTILGVGAFVAAPAAAQDTAVNQPAQTNAEVGAPTPADPPTAQAAQEGIQDIVITAQRRSENLQRAAIAVTAVTGDTLEAAGITRPTELTSVVPALQVTQAAGPYNLFYLRGVGNFNGNALSDSAVAFNFDGVYIGRPSSSTGFFYDLERVEVVKGPQGTLYGRNATGGAINVISHKPDLGKLGGDFSAEYGNYDNLRIDGALNVPIGDIAAFRVAGIHVSHDGYMNDGTDDQDDWGGRASFRVDPSNALRIVVTADYFDQGGNGPGSTPRAAAVGNELPTAFDVDKRIGFLSPQGQAFYTTQRNSLNGRNFAAVPLPEERPFLDNKFWGISSTIDWTTSVGTLTVIPAYREGKLNYQNFSPGFYIRQKEKSDQTSVEARFATPNENPLRALVGAFYFKENTTDPFVAYVHQSNGSFQNLDLETESEAIFGRLTYAVTPDIRFTVGARQTWEKKSFQGDLLSVSRVCIPLPFTNCPDAPPIPYDPTPPAVPAGGVVIPTFGPPPFGGIIQFNPPIFIPGNPVPIVTPRLIQSAVPITADNEKKFDKFTWRVGADWDITPRNLLYASYETGFKAGGFFFATDNPATSGTEGIYQPESIKAITLGSKNRFFNNRVQLNVELFHWKYSDQQISHLGTDFTGTPIFPTENVGKATFKGFEIESSWKATSTTTLNADLQYLDAKYDNFVYTTPNQNGGFFNGTACPNAAPPTTVYTIDCSGKRPPNAPAWTLNLGAQQQVPLSFGDIVLDARAHYQSKTLTGLEFLKIEEQEAYWLVDAAITFYAPERKYFVGAFVNNLFDETVLSNTFPTPFSSFFSSSLRPPRTYGVRAGINF